MKTIFSYLKGLSALVAIIIGLLLFGLTLLLFNAVYALVVAIILIAAIFVLPYFIGRKDKPHEPGEYSVKKIKE
ncbi:MAG: hypothetical protein QF632_03000 [Candidatus Woesearchaeota archaeon]|jgi:hypothetical protein|nr:hypothetical protein [Candidatus Woesearchaeota archaeon]MDP7323703.1 hypothetical protein [Candidatus Woesearchaeota archaeon]MDP7457986.1 hypothetical protein [Candidatus Woesearchaeota archaeon]|tara:strand:- start:179 stop:400 length:222 start_codon:yes stop_codon:yes gene_type:complete